MFTLIQSWRESRARLELLRAETSLKYAETQRALSEARHVGTAVQPGHYWVNSRGVQAMPFMNDPNKAVLEPMEEAIARAPEIDLVAECMEPQQAYAFIGGARQGKSWAAQHVAAAWQQAGRQVVVIAPKWNPSEWRHCQIYGPQPEALLEGITTMCEVATCRQEMGVKRGIAGQDYPPILVVLDDWLVTLRRVGTDARDFIEEAAVVFASQNVTVLSIVHADTATGFGVDRIGKGLVEDSFRVCVRKRRDGAREYGVLYPSEKSARVKGQLLYPQYGYIPKGAPQWVPPTETGNETAHETARKTAGSPGKYSTYTPGSQTGSQAFVCTEMLNARERAIARLPQPPPRNIRVRDRDNWRTFKLSAEDGMKARFQYGRRGKIQDVVKFLKGSKTLRLAMAKALLRLPSDNYEILED